MSESALLADHLDQRTESILTVWRTTVDRVGDVPEAEKLSNVEFRDHVPMLLDRLAERLRGQSVDVAYEGKKHGEIRWQQGYDIAEVVKELRHLRTALKRSTAEFARGQRWDLTQLEKANEAIDDILDEAAAESVRQYQEDSHSEAQAALAEIKQRQDEMEEAWLIARREQFKLRTILANLPVAVWVVDVDGTVSSVNSEAEQLWRSAPGVNGSRVNVFRLGPDMRITRTNGDPCPEHELPAVRALRGEIVTQEEMVWFLGNESRTISVNAAPLADGPDITAGAVVVAQDITPRKRVEEQLRRQLDFSKTITETLAEGLCTNDPRGLVTFLNPAAAIMLGWTEAELLGRNLHETIHSRRPDGTPYPSEECPVYRVIQSGATVRGDEIYIRRDGTPIYVEYTASPIVTDGRIVGVVQAFRDISERKRLEENLEQQRELAEEASRHKTRLVSALSHDARTPLNAVVLAAELLEIHFNGDADAEVQECLLTIRHSVRNVLDLLRDLLDLSKLDAGASPAEDSRFLLEPVLAECLASVERQARIKGLDIIQEFGDLAGKSLETDRAKLKQILCNFLSNALRYSERGHIRIFCEQTSDQICIGVEDTGVGIDPRDQDRIFDEFAVLEQPRRAGDMGTGLGLAICRRLAELLKGKITLRSTPGLGSTFTLVLPSSVLTLGLPRQEAIAAFETPTTEAGAILVAEDHQESRQTLAKVLRRMGYRALEASTGREVLKIVHEERLSAIFMDVNMPDMDGIEATLAIRAEEQFRDLPIFALTGDVSVVNQHRIGEVGVNGYLEKPVTWEVLKQALGSLANAPR